MAGVRQDIAGAGAGQPDRAGAATAGHRRDAFKCYCSVLHTVGALSLVAYIFSCFTPLNLAQN